MKILSAEQIRQADAYTIRQEPIASIDLMERASLVFVQWLTGRFQEEARPVRVFCGPGNNGGDGLAVARLLHQGFRPVEVIVCQIGSQQSPDFQINLERLLATRDLPVQYLKKGDPFPELPEGCLLIDALFGSGLNRPVEGYWARLIDHLNQVPLERIAIDIPSGMFADQATEGACIHAHYTFSFERPKLAFFFPENQDRCGHWVFGTIGLDPGFLAEQKTPFYYLEAAMVRSLIKKRAPFEHKGSFGHCLLIAGSYGKAGAAVLAARACLRSGAGLLTVHVPKAIYHILQTGIPEAMVSIDPHEEVFSRPPNMSSYKSLGIGCGLGTEKTSQLALKQLLETLDTPAVIDADALNILAQHPDWLTRLSGKCILTPHPKEFERLFGKTRDDFARNELQRSKAKELGIFILLKGAYSCLASPEGNCYFNSTGNPGMGTAGSGDVLTGMIAGLLARGYSLKEAGMLGMYLHGRAGDLASAKYGQEAMISSDIIEQIGNAYKN